MLRLLSRVEVGERQIGQSLGLFLCQEAATVRDGLAGHLWREAAPDIKEVCAGGESLRTRSAMS